MKPATPALGFGAARGPIETSPATYLWCCSRTREAGNAGVGFGAARGPIATSPRPTCGVACEHMKPAMPAWGLGPLAAPSRRALERARARARTKRDRDPRPA